MASSAGKQGARAVADLFRTAILRTSVAGVYRPQPSVFFLPGLRSQPFWSNNDCGGALAKSLARLEENVGVVRAEYEALAAGGGATAAGGAAGGDYEVGVGEHTLHDGRWDWHSYIQGGARQASFAGSCPRTAALLEDVPGLMTGVPTAYAFFSALKPGSSIRAHHAPANLRLRVHLPLIVPPAPAPATADTAVTGDDARLPGCCLRVAGETRRWEEGRAMIFDDAYEHEVWYDADGAGGDRVVLLFDVWHPDVAEEERVAITDMFGTAADKGWLKQ